MNVCNLASALILRPYTFMLIFTTSFWLLRRCPNIINIKLKVNFLAYQSIKLHCDLISVMHRYKKFKATTRVSSIEIFLISILKLWIDINTYLQSFLYKRKRIFLSICDMSKHFTFFEVFRRHIVYIKTMHSEFSWF